MNYTLGILRRAQKELSAIEGDAYIQMRDAIRALAHAPRPIGSKKLRGRSGWRIRVGHYRVIYEIDDTNCVITIMRVGHRREIYR